ncbi:unnamed protein product [Blepharisma stoltei]|uniref:GB1/RHD3-type G domain-containing protein n=1 Tax=Blepharisma stoltei TaxID=1481888 RepID=A0AAU9IPK6_9CILI|nr:unnamed protein product [Blepharisma stoltei]
MDYLRSSSYHEEPLLLISYDSITRKFQLEQKGLDFLKSLNEPLGVISVAGMYRTGKSYLLNRVILNRKKGFGVGPTVNPCTKGLWIWGSPISGITKEGKPCNVIIIDSEGIGALDEDSNHDTRIFSLAILLSSNFIYNSVGAIDEDAIQNLSLVVNLTKHIHLKSSQSQSDELGCEDYAAYFPSFLWVARDFTLKLIDPEGKKIAPKEYLELALQPQKGFSDTVEEKNRIRKLMSNFFKEIDCCTLIRPVSREEDLQRLDDMDENQLRPEFVEQILDLRKKVLESINVKIMNGKELSGEMIASYLEAYVESINSGIVPNIENAWSYICQNQNRKVFEESKEIYQKTLEKCAEEMFPAPFEKLIIYHKTSKHAALEYFESKSLGEDKSWYLNELIIHIKEKFELLKEENITETKEECAKFLTERYMEIDQKIRQGEIKKLMDFERALRNFENDFDSKGPKGPNSKECFLDFYREKLRKVTDNMLKQALNELELQHILSTEQILRLETELKFTEERLISERNDSLNRISLLQGEKSEYAAKEKSLKEQVSHLIEDKDKMENELRDILDEYKAKYQKEVDSSNIKVLELNDYVKDFERENARKIAELEEEKALLSQKISFLESSLEDYKLRDKASSEKIKEARNDHNQVLKIMQAKFDSQITKFQEKLDGQLKEVSDLEAELDNKERTVEDLQFKLTENQSQNAKIIKELQNHNENVSKSLKETENEFKEKLEEQRIENLKSTARLRARLDETEKKLRGSEELQRSDMSIWAQDNAILVQKIEFLEQELEEEKSKRDEDKKYYESMVSALEIDKANENSSYPDELHADQSQKILNLWKENETLKLQMNTKLEELMDINNTLESKIKLERNDWMQKEHLLKEQIDELSSEKSKLQTELSRRSIQNDYSHKRLSSIDVEKEMDHLKSSYYDEIEILKSQHEATLLQLKSFYEQEKNRFDQRIQQEKSKTERHINDISEDYEKRLETETINHEEEIHSLHNEFREMEGFYTEEITKLNEKIELDSQKIDSLEKHITNLKTQLDSTYDSHSNALESHQESFNQQRQALFNKLETMAADIAEKDKNLILLRHAKEQVDRQLTTRGKDFEELNEKYFNDKNSLLDQLSKIKTEKDEVLLELAKANSKAKRELALYTNEIELLQKKLSEIEIQLEESESRYKDSILLLKEEAGSQSDIITQRLFKENETLQHKLSENKKAYKQLSSSAAKQNAQYEKEKEIFEEKISELDKKYTDLEKQCLDILQNKSPEKLKPEKSFSSSEADSLRAQISKLDRELASRQISYDRDKNLWENKFNFLLQQRDQARKELASSQEKFEIVIEEIKSKSAAEKEKFEIKTNSMISAMESKFNIQNSEIINKNESQFKQINDKYKQSERKIQELAEELEKERREKAAVISSCDRKIIQSQEAVRVLENEIRQEREGSQDALVQLMDKFTKERDEWRNKMAEYEKKIKDLESHKAQQFILHEKERAKWALEKDSIISNQTDAQHQLTHVLKRQDSLKKENEKLKAPRTKLIPKKPPEISLSTNISYEDFSRFNTFSGKSTPTNLGTEISPRVQFPTFTSPQSRPHSSRNS